MKTFIKNRKGQKVSVLVEKPRKPVGLAFVMHGLAGSKEHPHIETIAKSFRDARYITVRFDATNAFGESEGDFSEATVTSYFSDLEDVILWAGSQVWYREPFVLSGHSLGGLCSLLFTELHPQIVKAVAPVSTAISGKMMKEFFQLNTLFSHWRDIGQLIIENESKKGIVSKLRYKFLEDASRYNILKKISKIIVPVLLIVGEIDIMTPLKQQQILFKRLRSPKELHVIEKAPHTFRDPQHLIELGQLFKTWISKVSLPGGGY